MTLTLSRWPLYMDLTRTSWTYTGCTNMNSLRQDFRKLSSVRKIDRTEIIYHAASRVVKNALWQNTVDTCCAPLRDNTHRGCSWPTYLFLTYNVFTVDTLRHAVTLTFDLLTRTRNTAHFRYVQWKNSWNCRLIAKLLFSVKKSPSLNLTAMSEFWPKARQ